MFQEPSFILGARFEGDFRTDDLRGASDAD